MRATSDEGLDSHALLLQTLGGVPSLSHCHRKPGVHLLPPPLPARPVQPSQPLLRAAPAGPAAEMARLLDPQGRLFHGRVISSADVTQRAVKDLDIVLGEQQPQRAHAFSAR